MAYPDSLDTFNGVTAQGTSLLSSPDHALDHRTLGSAVGTIERVVGTTAGTSVLKNFAAGDFPARINASNVLQQTLQGTINASSIGTPMIRGGTVGTAVIGTSTIQGGTVASAIINNPTIGTPAIQGGTANGIVLGTPTIGTVTVPGTVNALSFSASIAPGIGSVADAPSGTMTVNAQQGNVFYSALGTNAGNRTIGTPLNPTGNQLLTFALKASGSANATIVWDSGVFRFSSDVGTPQIGTAVAWNYFGWRRNHIDSKWDFQGQAKSIS